MASNFDQLSSLYWIAHLGSFRAAAARLNLSQPSISLRIKRWEQTLGFQLFDRHGGKATLTARGAVMLEYAERMMSLMEDVEHRFAGDDLELRGSVRLGVFDSFALAGLSGVLNELELKHPLLKVSVTIDNSVMLTRQLMEGTLDLCVVSEPGKHAPLRLESLTDQTLVWVAAPGLFAHGRELTAADMATQRIFTNPAPSITFSLLMDWFGAHDLTPAKLCYCNSLMIIIMLVLRGMGVSLVPAPLVADDLSLGRMIMLNVGPPLPRPRVFLAHQRRPALPAIQAVARIISQVSQGLAY